MNSITLQELFRKPDKFNIPSYQRAYAWVDKQREQFIKDLQETTCGYYLGHYLFEEDATNKVKNVIDGQQRLTTVVIFMSCLHHELMSRTDVPDEFYQEMQKCKFLNTTTLDFWNERHHMEQKTNAN